jgi:hypothetical protein
MNSNFTALDGYLSGGSQLQNLNIGQMILRQYLDYIGLGSAPANPASGICRVYFDLGTGQWKGINSTGASCSPSGNATGTTGAIMYYASNGTVGSPSLCTVDISGNLTCTSFVSSGVGTPKFDIPEGANPGNPSAGVLRFYADSTSHKLTCLTSGGAACWGINWGDIGGSLGSQSDLNSALNLKAPIASPTFTGTPAAPTAAIDTNTTQLASTAFVLGQAASATPLIDGTAAAGTSTRFARSDHVHPTDTTRAPLASPTFIGTVTFPLEATTTNCASSGGTCADAPVGRVSIAAAATTVTVATTAVTANSEIMITEDSTLGAALSVTCDTTLGRTYAITTRTAGTSFVITASAAPAANPACLSYRIVN